VRLTTNILVSDDDTARYLVLKSPTEISLELFPKAAKPVESRGRWICSVTCNYLTKTFAPFATGSAGVVPHSIGNSGIDFPELGPAETAELRRPRRKVVEQERFGLLQIGRRSTG
jgi:hypothetical protein